MRSGRVFPDVLLKKQQPQENPKQQPNKQKSQVEPQSPQAPVERGRGQVGARAGTAICMTRVSDNLPGIWIPRAAQGTSSSLTLEPHHSCLCTHSSSETSSSQKPFPADRGISGSREGLRLPAVRSQISRPLKPGKGWEEQRWPEAPGHFPISGFHRMT